LNKAFAIRDLTAEDKVDWLELWSGYLAFYNVDLDPTVTDHTWARLHDPTSALQARVAAGQAGLLGFAIHLHHPSTWVAGEDCYLEDLFVAEAARGLGIGRALIDDLQAIARSQGWHRLYWHTDQDNARARGLYDSIVPSDGHVRYRLKL
jgi:GNAT superfamily N-acetyltransferase